MTKKIIKITLPDGSMKEFSAGTTAMQVAESIGKRLASDAIAAEVNGMLIDMSTALATDANFKIHTFSSEQGKKVFWHSASHILAQAVKRLYSKAKLTIGPAIESGFYYDIAHEPFHPSDLEKIEAEMAKIVAANYPVERLSLSTAEAKKMFKDNKYKLEIIDEEAKGREITAYKQGEFTDLCRGPHAPSTGSIKAFKLTKVSSAYWRGNQKNDELQRIYGVAFPEKKMLDAYLSQLELAEKNDHRKLGKELDLIWFHDWSPGSPFFLPKGAIIYNELVKFMRDELYAKQGYCEVITPQLFNKKLWELSGHWENYKENMFIIDIEGEEFGLKPMNCPSHILLFKSRTRSYRELPLRIADFCALHRNELSGVLGGLTRVRKFSQDDAHIFCTKEQAKQEILNLLDFVKVVYTKVFNFEFKLKLSTRPDKFMGDLKTWEFAEKVLGDALTSSGLSYRIKPGEGTFYAPKIDIDVKDSIGREWQLGTIQLDFQMPAKMGAEYEGSDGKKHNAVIIHKAVFGSIERFIGLLIEHYAGKFPLWLSPEQVRILTVADRFNDYAKKVAESYRAEGIRAELDTRAESISYKVREAELAKVNYIMVVGEKEQAANTVTVRKGKEQYSINAEKFLKKIAEEIKNKM